MIQRFLRPRINLRPRLRPKYQQRHTSNNNNNHPRSPSSTSATTTSSRSRADRILSRLPRPLQRYTTKLRNAPISHVASFLILHELTAVVPLFALVGLFHYTDWVPLDYMTEHYGGYVREGVGRFERYFKRKRWFGFDDAPDQQLHESPAESGGSDAAAIQRLESSDARYKIVVEVALAYAITKALLPVRIVGSLWATPWFAGLFTKLRNVVSKK